MSLLPLPPWLNGSPWQLAEVSGGDDGCPGLCGRGTLGCRSTAEASSRVLHSSFPLRWLVMELQITL